MKDETPIGGDGRARDAGEAKARPQRRLPEPLEAAGFALQERVIWPLQDRFSLLPGPSPALIGGGAAALVAVVVGVALLASGGGSSQTTTVSEAPAPHVALAAPLHAAATKPKPKKAAPRETLHGAAPVFSPPSPASKGGEKTGGSKATGKNAAASEGSGSGESASSSEASGTASPASATISSDPKKKPSDEGAAASSAARAALPAGPPAGPAALKVAREFAQGFVVYETGGEATEFRDLFKASATPELTRALLKRPPKQPAGVKVPQAKVLNVVAGPSQGKVYAVSVSLLRVGVTSELRLQMEQLKKGKRAEWRVTSVLG